MKGLLLLLVLLFSPVFLNSQSLSVKSFRQLSNDLDARVNVPMKDQNGDICAILKVVTTQFGFTFDCGQIGIVKIVQKPSEIWVYVPYGTKRITISHSELGLLRDYLFPVPIEEATVYELVLTTGKVITTVEETITSQWLLINPEPSDAMIYINDQFIKNGLYQAKLKPGSYTYRLESPLYHSEAGKINIADSKTELNVKLQPAFGYLSVNTTPEQDAKVIIDGKPVTGATPFMSDKLSSGEHTIQIVRDMYKPVLKKVIIADGQTLNINVALSPNFAELKITSPTDATIFINNEQIGTGTWNGRLNAGIYSIEVRREKNRPAKMDIDLAAGERRAIDLQPIPICGSLDVMTTPPMAFIKIDGKDYGTTPNTINKLLIGEYTLTLEKQGYGKLEKTITINENLTTDLNVTLSVGMPVTITSEPVGASLNVDGNITGTTPASISVYPDKKTEIDLSMKYYQDLHSTLSINSDPSVHFVLKPKMESIAISSKPTGAICYIDNVRKGSTPLTVTLPQGTKKISFVKESYSTVSEDVTIDGSSQTLNFALKQEYPLRSKAILKNILWPFGGYAYLTGNDEYKMTGLGFYICIGGGIYLGKQEPYYYKLFGIMAGILWTSSMIATLALPERKFQRLNVSATYNPVVKSPEISFAYNF